MPGRVVLARGDEDLGQLELGLRFCMADELGHAGEDEAMVRSQGRRPDAAQV